MTYFVAGAGQCLIVGLSSDTKPTASDSNGFTFVESDTGKVFRCDGQAWSQTSFTGSYANLTNVPSTFTPAAHTHTGVYEPANANVQAHIASAHAPSNAQKNSDITKAEIEAVLTGVIASHSHSGGSSPFVFEAELGSNVSTGADTNPVDVTGLVFNYAANSLYVAEVFGSTRAAAATTGVGLHLNTSSAVTSVWGQFSHQLANTGTVTGGSTIADDASVGVSSGRPSANTDTPFYFSCLLKSGANTGTAQLRLMSEVAAVSTIMAGTFMRVYKKA